MKGYEGEDDREVFLNRSSNKDGIDTTPQRNWFSQSFFRSM